MKSPISYVGGKNRLISTILPLIPEHKTFVELFGGSGQVLFQKPESQVEIFNDLSDDVYIFFRTVQWHHEELLRYLKFVVVGRKWFETFARTPNEGLSDIQRAAKFLYLQRNSFGGLVVRQNYALHVANRPSYNPENLEKLIEAAHVRLRRVQIEHLPYEQLITRTDRTQTFFFADPPYLGRQLYKHNFTEEDFRRLASVLGRIRGKFLLTLNDTPETRSIFQSFRIRDVQLAYSCQRAAGRRYRELLITNY